MKVPKINVDIVVVENNKILFGFLTKKWSYEGKRMYGVPGRDILFRETIQEAVKRSIKEDLGCDVVSYKVIAVNENFALENHYIGIGVVATISGKVQNLHPEDWEKWEWLEKSKIPQNLFPAAKNAIESYIKGEINVTDYE